MKELKVFKNTEYLIGKWSEYFWRTKKEEFKLKKIDSANKIGLEILKTGLSFVFFGILLWIVINRKLTIGDYVSLSQTLASSIIIIQIIANRFASIYNTAPYLSDFFSFLGVKEETNKRTCMDKNMLQDCIEVRNLSFSYPNTNQNILSDISFTINKGESIAIVGKNGSGKSTLVKCLIGLYSPSQGSIYYDGMDLEELDVTNNVSAIFQDFIHYNLSLRENVGISYFGDLENDE